jgi:hypothetical protein
MPRLALHSAQLPELRRCNSCERISAEICTQRCRGGMRLIIVAIPLFALGSVLGSITVLALKSWAPLTVAQGQLRCKGAGALIINVDGKDYAVNGKAGPSYPPIQRIWNSDNYPNLDIGRIIDRGLTLCDW